jgi:hypothetical protein
MTVTILPTGSGMPTGSRRGSDNVTGGSAAARPTAIRLRRAPSLEPGCDVGAAGPPTLELPIEWAGRADRAPASPSGRSRLPAPGPAARVGAPAMAERYVRLCLEVLNGFRPAAHLRTLTGPVEFGDVVTQLARRRNGRGPFPARPPEAANARAGRAVGVRAGVTAVDRAAQRNVGPGAPPAGFGTAVARPLSPANHATGYPPAGGPPRPAGAVAAPFRLQKLRHSEPVDGVAEVVAVLSQGGLSLAMALRLERRDDRWGCVLVQII